MAHRTPEQGHTAPCLASAMISAIQNARDASISDSRHAGNRAEQLAADTFRSMAQDNTFLAWADIYLSEGLAECICPI